MTHEVDGQDVDGNRKKQLDRFEQLADVVPVSDLERGRAGAHPHVGGHWFAGDPLGQGCWRCGGGGLGVGGNVGRPDGFGLDHDGMGAGGADGGGEGGSGCDEGEGEGGRVGGDA